MEFISNEAKRLTTIVDALLDVARLDAGELSVSLVPTDVGTVVDGRRRRGGTLGERSSRGCRGRARTDPGAGGSRQAEAGPRPARLERRQVLAARRRRQRLGAAAAGCGRGRGRRRGSRDSRLRARADLREVLQGGGGHGTGLGLFIAQGLVREMGGRIRVDSEEGRGSTFAFDLPVAQEETV